jgi:hypothetical protein
MLNSSRATAETVDASEEVPEGSRSIDGDAEAGRYVGRPESHPDELGAELAEAEGGDGAVEVRERVGEHGVHRRRRHEPLGPPLAWAVQDDPVGGEAGLHRRLHLGQGDRLGHQAVFERQLEQPRVRVRLDAVAVDGPLRTHRDRRATPDHDAGCPDHVPLTGHQES